jgi:signal peptidase I
MSEETNESKGWSGRKVAAVVGIVVCAGAALAVGVAGPPVQRVTLASTTMSPAWDKGEQLWVLRWPLWGWAPERGDVVVFAAPPATGERQGDGFIKRVAGLPGEEVAVDDGVLLVDGREVQEPWRNTAEGGGPDQGPVEVPPGRVFLLGDDRANSYDSRSWGLLDIDRIEGVALATYW